VSALDHGFIFYLDPIIFNLGPLHLRYYGLIFASMLYVGFLIWRWQMLRGEYSIDLTNRFLLWGVIAVIVGSRLGHCFFYEPRFYLSHPLEILYFWKGGLASHGATIGLLVALLLFAWKYHMRPLEVLDRFSMSAAVGAAAVRLGNFFNSEIVGRVTDGTWGVKFLRYDCHHLKLCDVFNSSNPEASAKWSELVQHTPLRHPSQLYEFSLGIFVLLSLFLIDRWSGKEKRPLGLLAGSFLVIYFTGRFFVEFFKEYQTGLVKEHWLTMGQYLSIIPVICGLALVVWALVKKKRTDQDKPEPVYVPPPSDKTAKKTNAPSKSGNRSKKARTVKKSGNKKKKKKSKR